MSCPLLSLAAAALLGAASAPPAEPTVARTSDPDADPAYGTPPSDTPGGPAAPAGAAQVGVAEAAARPTRGRSWFAFPVAFWLPETKLGFGGAAGLHFHVAKGAGDSNVFLVAGYTILGQGTVDLASDVLLKNGTLLTGRLRLAYYPDTYYGIGPTTKVEQREDLTRRFVETIVAADFPIVRGLRGGPRLHARAEEIGDVTPGGQIAAGDVVGAHGFDAIGLGGQLTWDSRDNPLWTTRGSYLQAWYLNYPGSLGRNAGFYRAAAEVRDFVPLGRSWVLALGAQLEHADARTPFSILPKLGSTRYLRGIRDGRFRDAIAWATQAELRIPFARRFAGAAFGALGDVGPSLSAMRADTIKVAGGVGLRYRLTDQGANLRVDLALSREGGVEVYVLLLEAL